MSSYATRLAQDLRNHFDDHDRVGHEAALKRMEAALEYAGLPDGWKPQKPNMAPGATFQRFPIAGCTRKLAPCECASRAQADVCMYRGPAPAIADDCLAGLPKAPAPLCEFSTPLPPRAECPRCKGTGEDPDDHFNCTACRA